MDRMPRFASSRMLEQALEEVRAWYRCEVALKETQAAEAHASAAAVLCVAHRVAQRATFRAVIAVSSRKDSAPVGGRKVGAAAKQYAVRGGPVHVYKAPAVSLRLRRGSLCRGSRLRARKGGLSGRALLALALDSCRLAVLPILFLLTTSVLRIANYADDSFDAEPGPV